MAILENEPEVVTRTRATDMVAILLTVGAIAWPLDGYRMMGLLLYDQQVLSGVLAVAIPLTLLSIRASAGIARRPWYDVAAAAVAFVAAAYMAVNYPAMSERVADRPWDGLIAGTVTLVLLVEALRRTVGLAMTIVVGLFLLLALFGHLLPGELAGRPIDLRSLLYYLSWDPTGILGTPLGIVTSLVIAFVFFGQILLKSGGSDFFTDISMALVGRFRGGQAKISVIASGLFGTISGSAVSNVVVDGPITIPMMIRAGYTRAMAGAIEAVASTGGQIMPPVMGAAAFLMAEFLGVPYTEVILAAAIPGVLYYAALFISADLQAARAGMVRVPEKDIPTVKSVLREGWHFPIPFAVLIVAMFNFNRSPEEAAMLAAIVIAVFGMIFGYKGQRLKIADLVGAVRETGYAVLDVIAISAAAGIVIGVINVTGIGFGLTLKLVSFGGGSLPLLLVIAAFMCIILGMGMPTAAVYILLATLIAPSLIEVGVQPMAAHMFILYFGMMSMITPPVALAAYAAASIAGEDPMKTGFWAMRFGWFAYVVPFMFIMAPELLMQGEWTMIVYYSALAFCGIWFISTGVVGYFTRRMGIVSRLGILVAGFAVLVPVHALTGAFYIDALGMIAGLAILGREWFAVRGGIATAKAV